MALPQERTPNPIWPSVRRLLRMAGRNRNWLYAAIGIDLVQAALLILTNNFLRYTFDAVQQGKHNEFLTFALITASLSVAGIPLSYLKTSWVGRFSERTLASMRKVIAARATVLPARYLEERHSGDLLSVINADLGKLKSLTSTDLLNLFGQSARAIGALGYIFSINWLLALVSTVMTPLIFLLVSALSNPIARRTTEMQDEIGQVNSIAQDSLAGLMVVKSFNLVKLLDDRFHLLNSRALRKGLGIARLRAIIDAVTYALAFIPFIIAMGFGGYLVITKQMTFGSLFAFINLLNFVVNPLASLPGTIASIGEASGAAQRIYELLDQEAERESGSITRPEKDLATAIRFRNVEFSYEDGNPVLKDLDLDIRRGQVVAIVGHSGGGKSTVLKLILGYYPLPDGRVTLFGDDLNGWRLSAAREQMAFVAQDTYLFPVSLAENIRLGRPDASQEQIEQAARLANIHDYIVTLPEGYRTLAGERGARLSGGQRQRISLARAVLKNAPILLLDEPTSALDTESEALVQEALERFTVDRTTVVIAHRLSTIKNADRVLVLDEGRIVEDGTHEELMAKSGLYLDLYQKQFTSSQSDPATAAGD
jgi:ABC-type multidrug transport system fused ATPase/permease subunit